MLRIREQQLKAIAAGRASDRQLALARQLRTEHPSLCAPFSGDELLECVAWSADQAMRHGLIASADLRRFTRFVLAHGRDFQDRSDTAWAVAILQDPDLIGTEKLDRLEEAEGELIEERA